MTPRFRHIGGGCCKSGTHRAPCTCESLNSLLNGIMTTPDEQGPSGRRDMMSYVPPLTMSRHRVQVHSCTKSNRPANSFILSSVAARGRSFRVFECRHFQMGIRRSVGNDHRVQIDDFDSTDNKAWIILPILDVFVRCPNRYIYTYIFFYFYIYIYIYTCFCVCPCPIINQIRLFLTAVGVEPSARSTVNMQNMWPSHFVAAQPELEAAMDLIFGNFSRKYTELMYSRQDFQD